MLLPPPPRCYVIAEAGVNHNGDVELAKKLIDLAADAGADAVKFQTFRADRLASADAPKATYQKRTTGAKQSQRDMLKGLELDEKAHQRLFAHASKRRITFLSTPFDAPSVELLTKLGVPAFKVGSGDLTNLPLLRLIAAQRKPVIVSTGMSTLNEAKAAVKALQDGGASEVAALHCVSAYPAPSDEANLRAMATMSEALGVPIGFSDHTLGTETGLAAVALGARVLEKHVTLDRGMKGPDHATSLEADDFTLFVKQIRTIEKAFGDGTKRPMPSEEDIARVARRSLVLTGDVRAGQKIAATDLEARRPATGISPMRIDDVVGKHAKRALVAGSRLAWEDLE